MDELLSYLTRFRRRMRLVDGWTLAQRSLWLVLLLICVIQIVGRILPIPRLWLWSLLPFLAWIVCLSGYALLYPFPPMRVARRVDNELQLFERLSTCLALENLQHAFPPALVTAQQQDALQAARRVDPIQAFPLPWLRRSLLTATLVLLAAVALAVIPNPMDAILAQRAAVAQAAREQAKQIEKLSQAIQSAEGLTPEEKEEILKQLAELVEKLRSNPGNLEQALADLSKMEEALKQKLDPTAAAKSANLQSLAAQLQALAGQEADPSHDASEAAADALSKLAEQLASMDEAQRQALAQALAQTAAQAAQSGNADLAQALAAMAQAVQNGDQNAASQSAQQAAQAMSQTQQSLNAQAARQTALSQLQTSRQSLAQAGQSTAQASGASGQAPGQGQNPGGNPGQGQAAGGGGTTANTLPPSTRVGAAGRPQGNKPLTGEDDLGSQIFVPWEHGLSTGNQLFIPGQDTGQGDTQVSQGDSALPGAINPSLVPYYQVFYSYLNAANQAMEQSYIPASLMDYIQAYFSQLEP